MADEPSYDVRLVTPERVLIDGPAAEVILRTGEGDITFLAGYAPLVGSVEPGVLRIVQPDGAAVRVATHGGFVQVESGVRDGGDAFSGAGGVDGGGSGRDESRTRVTLLIGVAELSDDIDIDRARAALERAQARLSELGSTGGSGRGADEDEPNVELVDAEAALRRAEVRIETAEGVSAPTS